MEKQQKPPLMVDKKLVHKHKEENVLVYNLRRLLPRKIEVKLFEDIVLSKLTKVEQEFIKKYYSKDRELLWIKQDQHDNNEYYVLHTLPHEIDIKFGIEFVKIAQLKPKESRLLLRYYSRDKDQKKFMLNDDITDEEELKILTILGLTDWHITDSDKTRISEILERVPEVEKENIFYGNMYVNLNHDFFFEHPNEHVPAMMVIEAARQFLIAAFHMFYNVPLKGVAFIVKGIQGNFNKYLELNYPVKFMATMKSVKFKRGYISFYDSDVTIFQRNQECSVMNFVGNTIKGDVFKELRIDKEKYQKYPRFHARSMFFHNISLRDYSKKKHLCDLVDISATGFQLKLGDDFNIEDINKISKQFEFFIYFQEIGFVHGACECVWFENRDDSYYAGFKITEIDDADIESLKEAIKRFC
ncbi:MAG: hypothetical protein A2Y34_03070, partial [Spirochaetes bacterium GWC1_27_15]